MDCGPVVYHDINLLRETLPCGIINTQLGLGQVTHDSAQPASPLVPPQSVTLERPLEASKSRRRLFDTSDVRDESDVPRCPIENVFNEVRTQEAGRTSEEDGCLFS